MITERLFERLPCLKEWLFLIVAGVLSLLGITLISFLVLIIKT